VGAEKGRTADPTDDSTLGAGGYLYGYGWRWDTNRNGVDEGRPKLSGKSSGWDDSAQAGVQNRATLGQSSVEPRGHTRGPKSHKAKRRLGRTGAPFSEKTLKRKTPNRSAVLKDDTEDPSYTGAGKSHLLQNARENSPRPKVLQKNDAKILKRGNRKN